MNKGPDLNDLHQEGRFPDLDEGEPLPPPPAPKPPRPAIDLADLARPLTDPCWGEAGWLNAHPEPRPMLLNAEERGERRPFLPRGKVALLAAAGGAGKTQALAQLALAVASAGLVSGERRRWLDAYPVACNAGHVLWGCGEEDRDELRRRLQKAAQGMMLTEEEQERAARYLWPLPLYGLDARLVTTDLEDSGFMFDLEDFLLAEKRDWAAVILDPGSRFMGADDEKDNAAATRFVELVERLTKVPGNPAVIVAMHTGKQGVREDLAEDDQYLTRGSSALVDGARWAASLRWTRNVPPGQPRFLRFVHTKTNYTPKAPPLDLVMDGEGFLRAATPAELEALREAQKGPPKPDPPPKGKGKGGKTPAPGSQPEQRPIDAG